MRGQILDRRHLILLLSLCWLLQSADTWAVPPKLDPLDQIVSSATSKLTAVSVLDVESGKVFYEHLAQRPVKPASVLKLFTTAAVLSVLGPEFQYTTNLVTTGPASNPILYLIGSGDPSLTIESVWTIGRELKMRGLDHVAQVVVDSSAMTGSVPRGGARAFLAGSSAAVFNFNSLGVGACPTTVGAPARLFVDPWELGASVKGLVRTVGGSGDDVSVTERAADGSYLASGAIGVGHDCVRIYRSVETPEVYLGRVLTTVLKTLGVTVDKGSATGTAPQQARLWYQYKSKPLSLIVRDLNVYSNNIIAEQLLATLGAEASGQLDRENGLLRLKNFLDRKGVSSAGLDLYDASGLDRDNQITAQALTRVLEYASKDSAIAAYYEAALAAPGGAGTLSRRNFQPSQMVIHAKTGSLSGVSSLAGYLYGRSGRKIAFAIIQNGAERESAHRTEDQLVQAIYQRY